MFQFCYDEKHMQGYDSSRGPEVKASSGRPAATRRLLKSCVPVNYVDIGYRKEPTFCMVHFGHDFLNRF